MYRITATKLVVLYQTVQRLYTPAITRQRLFLHGEREQLSEPNSSGENLYFFPNYFKFLSHVMPIIYDYNLMAACFITLQIEPPLPRRISFFDSSVFFSVFLSLVVVLFFFNSNGFYVLLSCDSSNSITYKVWFIPSLLHQVALNPFAQTEAKIGKRSADKDQCLR